MLVVRDKGECGADIDTSVRKQEFSKALDSITNFEDRPSGNSLSTTDRNLPTTGDLPSKPESFNEVVSELVARYRHEWDYYHQVARLCAEQCERGLDELGIQAMVTYRAKKPDRLENKLKQRYSELAPNSVEDITGSLRDLAGVRIAIYFPGDRREVDRFIHEQFEEAQAPTHVEGSKSLDYITRAAGYRATHYRIRLKKDSLCHSQLHYCDSIIEIQVASVLMHAWAEVEHDLAYKPKMGEPSQAELEILHELNCLVHAGEIALERLQKAFADKARNLRREFFHHFELAAYLYTRLRPLREKLLEYPVMGRTDLLFELLRGAGLNRPEAIEHLVHAFDLHTENRPIVDQLIDQLIHEHPELESRYNELICRESASACADGESHGVSLSAYGSHVGLFISRWACLEGFLRRLCDTTGVEPHFSLLRLINDLHHMGLLQDYEVNEVESLRHLRNVIIHGSGKPSLEALESGTERLEKLLDAIRLNGREDVRMILNEVIKGQGFKFLRVGDRDQSKTTTTAG
jgi:ppGpp synthetase/RelA/SpoT-type nucleotidyltranferase